MPTVAQIVQDVMLELSLVPGQATQAYATPRLIKYIEDAFFMVFDDEHNWNAYCDFVTLSVANGVLAQDVIGPHNTPILEYRDVIYVFPDGSNKPLLELGTRINPTTITGGSPRFKAPSTSVAKRPFKLYPMDFTGTVQAFVRARPSRPFNSSTVLHLDQLALSKGAAFMYLAAVGTNAGHAASLQAQFVTRVNQVKAQENDGIYAKDSRQEPSGTDEWREAP